MQHSNRKQYVPAALIAGLVVLLGLGLIVVVLHDLHVMNDPNEGIDVVAAAKDAEFGEDPVTTEQYGEYTGTRPGEQGKFVAQYSTQHANGKPKVVKTILSNRRNGYGSNDGHYVLYQYHREDGTLERDDLVNPGIGMGCGVWTKNRLRQFDAQGKQTEERYLRPDKTVGAIIDMQTNLVTKLHADGVKRRFVQEDVGEKHMRQTQYRKDGETVWWKYDSTDGKTHVFFDLYGNPCNKVFVHMPPPGGWRSGVVQMYPVIRGYDLYLRPDGTRNYCQTWHCMHDGDKTKEICGGVSFFDATGEKIVRTYVLAPRPEGQPRFIKTAFIQRDDGTVLVRSYRSPGCRASEGIADAEDGKVRDVKTFSTDDRFMEDQIEDHYFHGVMRDVWGDPDANEHDI